MPSPGRIFTAPGTQRARFVIPENAVIQPLSAKVPLDSSSRNPDGNVGCSACWKAPSSSDVAGAANMTYPTVADFPVEQKAHGIPSFRRMPNPDLYRPAAPGFPLQFSPGVT